MEKLLSPKKDEKLSVIFLKNFCFLHKPGLLQSSTNMFFETFRASGLWTWARAKSFETVNSTRDLFFSGKLECEVLHFFDRV